MYQIPSGRSSLTGNYAAKWRESSENPRGLIILSVTLLLPLSVRTAVPFKEIKNKKCNTGKSILFACVSWKMSLRFILKNEAMGFYHTPAADLKIAMQKVTMERTTSPVWFLWWWSNIRAEQQFALVLTKEKTYIKHILMCCSYLALYHGKIRLYYSYTKPGATARDVPGFQFSRL